MYLSNETYRENKLEKTITTYVYAKKTNSDEEWVRFDSQLDAANKLNLHAANINKVGFIYKII